MSKKLFGQIVLLIAIGNAFYFAGLRFMNWRAEQSYAQRMKEISEETATRAEATARASRVADELESAVDVATTLSEEDTGENEIDGQIVHKVDGNWVNEDGVVVRSGD